MKKEEQLRMLLHPEKYTDEQLAQMLDETRVDIPDTNKEWQRLTGRIKEEERSPFSSPTLRLFTPTKKIAAIFIGLLMLSGIAYAAIHLWSTGQRTTSTEEESQQTVVTTSSTSMEHSEEVTDSISQTRIFEDTSLDEIVNELGAYYKKEVDIQNTQAHELRIFYKWNRKDNLEEIVSDLNHFDHVNLAIEDDKLIVKP